MFQDNYFVISKKDVIEGGIPEFLFGYAISESSIVFGTEGLNEFKLSHPLKSPMNLNDGRFVALIKKDREIVIKTDETGQELLYLYSNADDWIVSNSFLLLAQKASAKYKLDIYGPAVNNFFLKNGSHIGEQLISHKTMIEQIKIVPINNELRVDTKTGELTFVENFSYSQKLDDKSSYAETLLSMLEDTSGMLSSIVDLGLPMNLFLSGGYDSRLILASIMNGNNDTIPENVFITSHESKVNDFRSVLNLSQKLDFQFNGFSPPRSSVSSGSVDSFRTYLSSSGGTYLPCYPVNASCQSDSVYFRLTGDQPTGWNFFVGNSIFNGTAPKIADDIELYLAQRGYGSEVKADFLSTFQDLDIDPENPYAMLLYYNSIRSRFHCGRNSYKSLGNVSLFTPLMQSKFVDIELKNSMLGNVPKQIFCDSFLALSNWAVSEPFETKERSFSSEFIDRSPFKGGVNITPKKYNTYGSPSRMFDMSTKLGPHQYPIKLRVDHDQVRDLFHDAYYGSYDAKESEFFTEHDFSEAVSELKERGSLSHRYRKTAHIVFTDLVLKIIG